MDRSKWWPFNIADILRSMSDAVITIDAAMRITSMNAAEAMTGFREAEAVGKGCAEVVRSEICSTRCPFKAVWERGETAVNFNVVLENRKGGRLPVSICTSLLKNEVGEKLGVVESIRDVSHILRLLDELKRSDEEIARKESELRALLQMEGRLENLIGKSQKMQEVFELIQVVAKSDATVLIQGESGTGPACFV